MKTTWDQFIMWLQSRGITASQINTRLTPYAPKIEAVYDALDVPELQWLVAQVGYPDNVTAYRDANHFRRTNDWSRFSPFLDTQVQAFLQTQSWAGVAKTTVPMPMVATAPKEEVWRDDWDNLPDADARDRDRLPTWQELDGRGKA